MSAAVRLPSPPSPAGDGDDASAGRVIRFPHGLIGFPDARAYNLETADLPGFYWLHSTEHAPLAFVLVDPFQVIEDFAVDLPPQHAEALGVDDPADVAVLAIATVPREVGEIWTANLQGPVAINFAAGLGLQFVRSDGAGVRTPFRPRLVGG